MVQYSKQELDTKIHAFMKKKMHQFPELEDEPYVLEQDESEWHEARRRVSHDHTRLVPIIHLGSLY